MIMYYSISNFLQLDDEMSSCPPTKPSFSLNQADFDEWDGNIGGLLGWDLTEDWLQHANPGAQKAANRDNLHAAFQ